MSCIYRVNANYVSSFKYLTRAKWHKEGGQSSSRTIEPLGTGTGTSHETALSSSSSSSFCLTACFHSPALSVSRLAVRSLVVAAAATGADVVRVFFELPLDGFRFFRAFFFSWNSSKLRDGRASIFSSKLKSLKDKVLTWKCRKKMGKNTSICRST